MVQPLPFEIVDHRKEPKELSSWKHHGNTFSCHFGINPLEHDEVKPKMLDYVGQYLNKVAGERLTGKQIEVMRLAFFVNSQAIQRSIGLALSPSDLLLNAAVGALSPKPRLIGCKGSETGEYYFSEAPQRRANVYVVYLNATIDGVNHKSRIVHSWVHPPVIYKIDFDLINDNIRQAIDKVVDNWLKLAPEQNSS